MAQAFRPPEDPLEDLPEPQPDLQGATNTSLDCGSNVYEKQELLHRPHAFALMHGENGAKIAYGELHWAIDVLIVNFKTTTVTVDDHCDHSHAPHDDHSHEDHTDHSHSSHTTTDHQHTITSDSHDGHTHSSAGSSNYAKDGSGGNSADVYDTNADSSGTSPQGSAYHHKHGGLTGFDGSETLSHSGVKTTSSYGDPADTGILDHSGVKHTDGSQDAPDGVLKHSGVTDTDGTTTAPPCVLGHTVNDGTINHADAMGQTAIPQITQQVPNIDTEDGDPMLSEIPNEYFQLTGFGDVYLAWKVDLELSPEVQKCWVQVGDPNASDIASIGVAKTVTNRLTEIPTPNDTGTEGVYSVKIGTVTEDNRIQQRVSSDVSWRPVVLDRTRN